MMEEEREPVRPAELNALTDRLIRLAADHEKAMASDVPVKAVEIKKDQDTDDR